MIRILLFIFVVSADVASAASISETYWSTYPCGGYIYHFNTEDGTYKIYTKLEVKDDKGKYDSYQLTEGTIQPESDQLYSLYSKDPNGKTTIDFSNTEMAVMKSEGFGSANLIQCDPIKAKKLIEAAEMHFQKCPKDVINCKSL